MSAFKLRPEQQRVIDSYQRGYAAVSAVPGAGKTTTLSALAAHLIEHRIFPRQRVVIVTYQNAAVANFQVAIRARLAERRILERGFIVRTLHGLANDVLQAAGHRAQIDRDAAPIDEWDARRLLHEIIDVQQVRHAQALRNLLRFPEMPAARAWPERRVIYDVVREALRELKLQQVDLDALSARLDPDTPWLPFVLDVCRAYGAALRERGLLEFDDMILQAVQVLERDDALCRRLRAQWPYLLEDEAQDSTPLQERMLLRIAGAEGNLVRVGDANQAILTSFTASDVRGFRDWLARPDVRHFQLRGSSRSTQAVIDLANRYVELIRVEFPVPEVRLSSLDDQPINALLGENPALPAGGRRTGLTVQEFATTDDEREQVIARAVGHLARNPEERVAILVGSRDAGYDYTQAAIRHGFPNEQIVRLLGGADGRPIQLVDRLLPALEYLAEPDLGWRLARALEAWSLLGRNDAIVQTLAEYGPSTSISLQRILFPEFPTPAQGMLTRGGSSPEEELTLRRLDAVPLWLSNRLAPPHELLALIAATIAPEAEERPLLNRVVATAQSLEPDPALDRLGQTRRFLTDLRQRRRNLRGTPEEHAIRIDPGTLTISTRHQAKGLEWDIVFAVGCDDFWFPGSLDIARPNRRDYLGPYDPGLLVCRYLRALLDGEERLPSDTDLAVASEADALEQVAERLRLMYVTITRARRGLWLSWHRQGWIGDRKVPRNPSLLLPLLQRLVLEIEAELTVP
jgi:DNA helicase-2/ATP-dependent DNA helicase PcrA